MLIDPVKIITLYGFDKEDIIVQPFGTGLINHTWKVVSGKKEYILQRVNDAIFKHPQDIADNIQLITSYLKQHHPEYRFVAPIASTKGEGMIFIKGEGWFRLFPFVIGSHSIDVVETTEQAYEAAAQFGRFTRLLSGIDLHNFKITIPSFHDLSLRYQQFLMSLKNGNQERIRQCKDLVNIVTANADMVTAFEQLKADPAFRLRVTHHDTKIGNVLFDKNDKGLCVIDLDTVMPGYFISDSGDMMRTYLSPVSEEEKDFDKIQVRDDFYRAIVSGYKDEMKDELSATELKNFFYAGKFMIYMQALRFLSDYINNDVYYGARYAEHNFIRASNQATLLKRLQEKEPILNAI